MRGGTIHVAALAILLSVLLPLARVGAYSPAVAGVWERLPVFWSGSESNSTETVEEVAQYVSGLAGNGKTSLAAAATEVGHWRLVNKAGEIFTAAGKAELAQALRTLAPEAVAKPASIDIYLTPDSLFRHSKLLVELPAEATLIVVINGRAMPVRRMGHGGRPRHLVGIGAGLFVEAESREIFDEMTWQLRRPVRRSKVRTLALEPGGLTLPGAAPAVDPSTRRARPDAVDPGHAGGALWSLSGQLVLLTGNLKGDRLEFKPTKGPEGSIALSDLWQSAAEADANVIALAASSPRQPGSRNWLWQRVGLATADKAIGAETLGEFLHTLAGETSDLVLAAKTMSTNRIEIDGALLKTESAAGGLFTEAVKGTWSDIVSETAGSLTVLGLKASLTRAARQTELDRRIVPFVPSLLQIGYLALVAAGVLGWRKTMAWWRGIWPAEDAREYGSGVAVRLARVVRWGAFVLLFLPLAGVPAIVALVADATLRLKNRLYAPRSGNFSPS